MYKKTEYSSGNYSKRTSKKRKLFRKFLLFIFIALLSLVSLHIGLHKRIEAQAKPIIASPFENSQTMSVMSSQINAVINQNPDIDIAVSLIDIKTNRVRNYGVQVPFEAASIGKLITAADFLHNVETGSQTLGEPIADSTAQAELRLMIENSDNDAWQALNDTLTLTSLAQYSVSVGITDYNLDDNTLTAPDIASLLQKLYEGKLLNKTNTDLLLSYMKVANEADYIPAAVPSNITVYHKAGLLDDRVHDAAIIDNGDNPYVLVVFTNGHGTYDDPARAQIFHNLTAATLTAYKI